MIQIMARRSEPFADRLWRKVERTKTCWVWTGARTSKGYGRLHFGARNQSLRAHRLAYMMEYGEIPAGQIVLHTCDNPPCVRPDHLRLGTAADNTADMMKKGRHVFKPLTGHNHPRPHARLTPTQVEEIRRLKREGRKVGEIAAAYGVAVSTVYAICQRTRWNHIL